MTSAYAGRLTGWVRTKVSDGIGPKMNEKHCMQVRVFSSREHTRALAAGDVWAVVGWSGDLVPVAERSADIKLIVPASGSALWADVWTVPAHAIHGSRVCTSNQSDRLQ